jgi:predicted site-specific integrase-resolvase
MANHNRSSSGLEPEPLPDKRAVARRYGICVRTLDRWIAEGKVPYLKLSPRVVRFRWEAVDRAVNRMTVKEVK